MARRKVIRLPRKKNPPTHVIKMGTYNSKGKSFWRRVGVAWERDDGFALRLDPPVVLDWHDFARTSLDEPTLMMFPNDE